MSQKNTFADAAYSTGEVSPEVLNTVIPILKENKVNTILDVGCLDGVNTIALAKGGFRCVTAIDTRDVATKVDILLGKAKEYDNIYAVNVRGKDDPFMFGPQSLDAVFVWRVIHNIIDKKERTKFISELWRILKEGGILILSFRVDESEGPVPDLENIYTSVREWIGNSGNITAIKEEGDRRERIYYAGMEGFLSDLEDLIGLTQGEDFELLNELNFPFIAEDRWSDTGERVENVYHCVGIRKLR